MQGDVAHGQPGPGVARVQRRSGDDGLDGLGDERAPRRPTSRGPRYSEPSARADAHHGEPGEGLGEGELEVVVRAGAPALAVVAGLMAVDQPDLGDGGLERRAARHVAHVGGLAEQPVHLAALVGGEVRADPLAEVGGLADVEHLAASADEQVHAGRAGELGREPELGGLRVGVHAGQGQQVVEAEDAEGRRPLEQQVEEVGRGEGVVEGAVGGLVVEPQPRRQGAEAAVRDLVAQEAPGEGAGVDERPPQARPGGAVEGTVEERGVEADVVADDHGAVGELDERRQHLLDPRGGTDHRLGDAREHGDLRGDGPARVHEGVERAEALAAAHLHRPDLGDGVGGGYGPVVSRSSTQNVTSRSGVPRSSNERCTPAR